MLGIKLEARRDGMPATRTNRRALRCARLELPVVLKTLKTLKTLRTCEDLLAFAICVHSKQQRGPNLDQFQGQLHRLVGVGNEQRV